jgi:hypothetical protein
MKVVAALAGVVALGSAVAPGSSPAKDIPSSRTSLCISGERTLFSCGYGAKTASVCAIGQQTVYRLGRPDVLELHIRSNGHDGRAYKSIVIGQGSGGYQSSLRFKSGEYSYVVSAGESGSLSDHPGTRLDVISVMKAHKDLSSHTCRRTTAEHLREAKVPNEPDPAFEAWY